MKSASAWTASWWFTMRKQANRYGLNIKTKQGNDMLEKNKKFEAYWESIGRPCLEFINLFGYWTIDWKEEPSFDAEDYRIKGDPHWELRREWIESDFTLPIEFLPINGKEWFPAAMPSWDNKLQYRKAGQKPESQTTGDKEMNGQQNPHAALIDAYCDDWKKTNEPWKKWQLKTAAGRWVDLINHPDFVFDLEYRRKPNTIKINGFNVPMPMTVKPEMASTYFYPSLGSSDLFYDSRWYDDETDIFRLERKICHLNAESAIIHAKALLSFTDPTQR